jgi:SAM-dependent methyltransferase
MRLADQVRSLRRLRAAAAASRSRMVALVHTERDANGVPIPPQDLIRLVAGTSDIDWFLASGQLGAHALRDILRRNKIDIEKLDSILDFGCGVGRVLRHLPGVTGARLCGCDYNPKLIRWCRKNLPFAAFSTNHLLGHLDYEDGSFELVFLLSVFTHLTAAQQSSWLDELGRVLRPGGYLLLTTHGQSYERHIPENLKERFRNGEMVVVDGEWAGQNRCATYHPEKFVREVLARQWQVVDFVPEGALGNPTQDVYLLQKRQNG